jgi:hypothetical protein
MLNGLQQAGCLPMQGRKTEKG